MDWFSALHFIEKIYVVSALAGGGVLILQILMALIGGDIDADVEADFDAVSPEGGLEWLSIQTLSSFFMMFGLVGMALRHEAHTTAFKALVGATFGGAIAAYVVYRLFASIKRFESSGNVDINGAVDKEGKVYLTITAETAGRVELIVQERLKIFDAVSENKEEIKSDARVRVVRVIDNKTLSVVKV